MKCIPTVFLAGVTVASGAFAARPVQSWSDARIMLEEFARCTVKTKHALVSQAIIEDWSVKQMADRELFQSDCVPAGGFVGPPPMALKAALGEQLLLSEKSELDPMAVAKAPPLVFQRNANVKPTKDLETEEMIVAVTQLGECVVRADPITSRALLATNLGSATETERARNLSGALSSCIPKGRTIELNVENVRQFIGLAYYRMMAATSSAADKAKRERGG